MYNSKDLARVIGGFKTEIAIPQGFEVTEEIIGLHISRLEFRGDGKTAEIFNLLDSIDTLIIGPGEIQYIPASFNVTKLIITGRGMFVSMTGIPCQNIADNPHIREIITDGCVFDADFSENYTLIKCLNPIEGMSDRPESVSNIANIVRRNVELQDKPRLAGTKVAQ